MKRLRLYLPYGLVLALGILAALPLFGSRFIPTHDGEYHLIRISEFSTMLKYGYLFPRWAPSLNSGYGLPLFNFHYPFPNYLGSLFHFLGFSLFHSFAFTEALGFLGSILFCFLWLKKLFSTKAAVVGTVLFSFVPYWFVDIYIRGSVGEVLAILWVMVVLSAIEYQKPRLLAIGIALLLVSHNILSLLFIPFLALLIFVRHKNYLLYLFWGIAISSYFWLPAIAERGFMTGLNSVDFHDHFPGLDQLLIPSWGTGFSNSGFSGDQMSYQIGIVPLLVFITGGAMIILRKKNPLRMFAALFCGVGITSVFFMLPVSRFFWEKLPLIQFVQYPWRFLSFWLPVTAFLGGYIASKIQRNVLLVSLCLVAMALTFSYTRPVTYEPRDDAYYLSRREFTDGTSSMGNNFTSIWTPWKEKRPQEKFEILGGVGLVHLTRDLPLDYILAVSAGVPSILESHILYYPGWKVWVDGAETKIDYTPEGTVRFAVPAGNHRVDVRFTETPLRRLADFVSALSLLLLLSLGILKQAYESRYR